MKRFLGNFDEAGADQMILMQQSGRNQHEHTCRSLDMFGEEVPPEFKAKQARRQADKDAALAPYIEAALR